MMMINLPSLSSIIVVQPRPCLARPPGTRYNVPGGTLGALFWLSHCATSRGSRLDHLWKKAKLFNKPSLVAYRAVHLYMSVGFFFSVWGPMMNGKRAQGPRDWEVRERKVPKATAARGGASGEGLHPTRYSNPCKLIMNS